MDINRSSRGYYKQLKATSGTIRNAGNTGYEYISCKIRTKNKRGVPEVALSCLYALIRTSGRSQGFFFLIIENLVVDGRRIGYIIMKKDAPLAQLVEQEPFKLRVVGSSPTGRTSKLSSSNGLGHGPFKAVTGVQIPSRVP